MMSLISLRCCGFLNFEHIQHIYQIFCYSPGTCVYALGRSKLPFKRSPKGFIVFRVMTKVKNICNGLFKFATHTLTIFIVSVVSYTQCFGKLTTNTCEAFRTYEGVSLFTWKPSFFSFFFSFWSFLLSFVQHFVRSLWILWQIL